MLWSGRVLAAIFILAGASKISYPVQVNPSFLDGALKVCCPPAKKIICSTHTYQLLYIHTYIPLFPGRRQVELNATFCHCYTPLPLIAPMAI